MFDDMEIVGVYSFYVDDVLVGEHRNALTSAGRALAIKSLLGYRSGIADSIAVGIGNTANTLNSASTLITNNSLEFEIARVPISSTSTEISSNQTALVFYAKIESPDQYQIREIALFPSMTLDQSISVDGSVIFNFDQVDTFVKYGTASYVSLEDSASARIGTQMLLMNQGNGTTNYIEKIMETSALSVLNRYSSEDYFKVSMYNTAATVASVNIRFFTDSSNYYTVTFTSSAVAGYQVVKATKSSATKVGSPDWGDIYSVRIWNSSSHDIYLDALRMDVGDYFLDTNFGMVSRAVLPSPILKRASIPMTVQYSLLTNFSGGV